MAAPVLGSLALAVGAAIVTVGVAALPLYGGLRMYRKYQNRKYLKSSGNGSNLNIDTASTSSNSISKVSTAVQTYFDADGLLILDDDQIDHNNDLMLDSDSFDYVASPDPDRLRDELMSSSSHLDVSQELNPEGYNTWQFPYDSNNQINLPYRFFVDHEWIYHNNNNSLYKLDDFNRIEDEDDEEEDGEDQKKAKIPKSQTENNIVRC